MTTDGLGRRQALSCMAWAGTAMVWTVAGGIPRSGLIGRAEAASPGFSFVQISDSHIGFNKAANPDPTATLGEAIKAIGALQQRPAMMIHTGDITHLSSPAQFDTAAQMISQAGLTTHYVPGEHDVLEEDGRSYLNRYGKDTKGAGWYSFDQDGVHFVGLVNVVDLKNGGMGNLGAEQLEWLKRDLAGHSDSTPIVVFAHIPLWVVYQEWGWGTDDGAEALTHLRRFGSVTVLNGHIHQVMQKIEGHVAFHTARSTAFPQPAPGTAPSPGPKVVPAGELRGLLGTARVTMVRQDAPLAIVDRTLADSSAASIGIDNFTFAPATLTVAPGTDVRWTNHDDIPHQIVVPAAKLKTKVLDTGDSADFSADAPGRYDYFCTLHPHMRGTVMVG